MPLFFFLIGAGALVGFVGLTGNGTLTLIGILAVAIGMLGSAVVQVRRRERDRRLDEAARRQAAKAARR